MTELSIRADCREGISVGGGLHWCPYVQHIWVFQYLPEGGVERGGPQLLGSRPEALDLDSVATKYLLPWSV